MIIGNNIGAQNMPGMNLMPTGLVGQTYLDPGDFALGAMDALSELAYLNDLGAKLTKAEREAEQARKKAEQEAAKAKREADRQAKIAAAQAERQRQAQARQDTVAARQAAAEKARAETKAKQATAQAERQTKVAQAQAQRQATVATKKVAVEAKKTEKQAAVEAKKTEKQAALAAKKTTQETKQITTFTEKCKKAAQAHTAQCIAFAKAKNPDGSQRMPTKDEIKAAQTESKSLRQADVVAKKAVNIAKRCERNAKAAVCQYMAENPGKPVPTAAELKTWKKNKDKQVVSTIQPALQQQANETKALHEQVKTARDKCRAMKAGPEKRACFKAALSLLNPKVQAAQAKSQALSGLMGLEDMGAPARRIRAMRAYSPFVSPRMQQAGLGIMLPSALAYHAGMFGLGQTVETIDPTGLVSTTGEDVFNMQFSQMSNLPAQPRGCTKNPSRPICMFYQLASDSQQMLYTLIQQIMTMMSEIMAILNELQSGAGGAAADCVYDSATGQYISQSTGMPCTPSTPATGCTYDATGQLVDQYGNPCGGGVAPGGCVGPGWYVDEYGVCQTGGGDVAPTPTYDPYGGQYGAPEIDYGAGMDYGGYDVSPGAQPAGAGYEYGGAAQIPEGYDVGGGGAYPEGGEAFIPQDVSSQGMIFATQPQAAAYAPMTEALPAGAMPSYPSPGGIQTTEQFEIPMDTAGGEAMFETEVPVPDYQAAYGYAPATAASAGAMAPAYGYAPSGMAPAVSYEETIPMLPPTPPAGEAPGYLPAEPAVAYDYGEPQYGAPDFEMMPQMEFAQGPEMYAEGQLPMLPAIPPSQEELTGQVAAESEEGGFWGEAYEG
jgi:hypothetical protein